MRLRYSLEAPSEQNTYGLVCMQALNCPCAISGMSDISNMTNSHVGYLPLSSLVWRGKLNPGDGANYVVAWFSAS